MNRAGQWKFLARMSMFTLGIFRTSFGWLCSLVSGIFTDKCSLSAYQILGIFPHGNSCSLKKREVQNCTKSNITIVKIKET